MKVFLKSDQVVLHEGGFLANKEGTPISNYEFVGAQTSAEYIIAFAKAAKGKDFKGKEAYDVNKLRADVYTAIRGTSTIEHIKVPKKPTGTVGNKLKAEALAFISHDASVSQAKKVNEFLSEFDVLVNFEAVGLFFDQEISYLKKIYTMKEIVSAVESCIEILVD